MKARSLSKWLTYSILLLNDLAEIWVQGCLIPKMRFDSLLSSSSKFLIRIAFSALAMPQTTHFTCCKEIFFLRFPSPRKLSFLPSFFIYGNLSPDSKCIPIWETQIKAPLLFWTADNLFATKLSSLLEQTWYSEASVKQRTCCSFTY